MRVLVTGSRDYADTFRVRYEIRKAGARYLPSSIVVVHGACPEGADAIADEFAREHHLTVERHPAKWAEWKRKTPANRRNPAGMIRNQEMVDAGADVCLAFINPCRMRTCRSKPEHGSHGASHCADLAEKAGISTRRYVA